MIQKSKAVAPSMVSSPRTISELLQWGIQELEELGKEEGRASSEALLSEIFNLQRSQIYLEGHKVAPEIQSTDFIYKINRRRQRVPLAYLTGKAYFWDEELAVSENCLIPRPETETLVEAFIKNAGFHKDQAFNFLDLCAGSGTIGIALLRYFEKAQAVFADISKLALELAESNLCRYRLQDRSKVLCSNLFEGMQGCRWDAILCNPPYLAQSDWAHVDPELLAEPQIALDGGPDGLSFYRRIIQESRHYLNENAWLVFEHGRGQRALIQQLFKKNGFSSTISFNDHAGIDRVIMARITD